MPKDNLEDRMKGLRTSKPEPKPEPVERVKEEQRNPASKMVIEPTEPAVPAKAGPVTKVSPGDEEYEAMYAAWEEVSKAATNFAFPSPGAEYVRYVKVQDVAAKKPVFLVSENAADVI